MDNFSAKPIPLPPATALPKMRKRGVGKGSKEQQKNSTVTRGSGSRQASDDSIRNNSSVSNGWITKNLDNMSRNSGADKGRTTGARDASTIVSSPLPALELLDSTTNNSKAVRTGKSGQKNEFANAPPNQSQLIQQHPEDNEFSTSSRTHDLNHGRNLEVILQSAEVDRDDTMLNTARPPSPARSTSILQDDIKSEGSSYAPPIKSTRRDKGKGRQVVSSSEEEDEDEGSIVLPPYRGRVRGNGRAVAYDDEDAERTYSLGPSAFRHEYQDMGRAAVYSPVGAYSQPPFAYSGPSTFTAINHQQRPVSPVPRLRIPRPTNQQYEEDDDDDSLFADRTASTSGTHHHQNRKPRKRPYDQQADDDDFDNSPFNNPGKHLRPSRSSGTPVPWHLNRSPILVPQTSVSNASLLKRNLTRDPTSNTVCKRGSGANDPENIRIVNLRETRNLSFPEIADELNRVRTQRGRVPNLTACGVTGRYNRTAPLLFAAQGRTFVPLSQRRTRGFGGHGQGQMTVDGYVGGGGSGEGVHGERNGRRGWHDELDVKLVEAVRVVDGQRWGRVADELFEKTGVRFGAEAVSRRHAML